MSTRTKHLIPIILVILLASSVAISYAQGQEPLQAQVDRTTLSTDESLVLTVTVSASMLQAPAPMLPDLEGFNVTGNSTSSQMSIINGNVKSQIVYTYRLQPYEAGDLVIDPINVTLDGETHSTQPIAIHVTQGVGAPPAASARPADSEPVATTAELAGQYLYVEAEIDNPMPYLGQQVIYKFRLYQARKLWDQPQYEAPAFTGFWNELESDQQTYRVQAQGRIYEVTEVQNIIFPSVVGPVTIDPARLTIPGSFFRSGQTLQTKPIQLEVQPLPANAPEGFGGAVGQFTLEGWLDSVDGKVNEPLTWHVTVNGWGSISTAPDPTWPEMPGWRDFESHATVHTEVQDGQVVGGRTYERLLIPSTEGKSTIPPLQYVYFDPVAGQYQTIRTEPILVSIAPEISGAGDPGASASHPQTGNSQVSGQAEILEHLATDIRHLKPAPLELGMVKEPVTSSALYWVAWAFPALGVAGYFAWQRRQRHLENNLGLVRSSQARKKARKALAWARKQRQDAYSIVGQILMAYLGDKLDQPVAGLTHQGLAHLLLEHGVSSDLVERVGVLLVSSDLGRFAPGADHPDHAQSLLQEAEILITALEKVL